MEDGETFDTIIERGKRALEYLSSRPEQSLLVVTHGFFLRVLVGLTMLQDDFVPEDLRRMYKTLVTRNTGITVLIRRSDTPDVWNVLTWNDHAHLG
jgi:broad specificity phosphatase PhoE